jgi:hypothetical protein
MRKTLYPRRSVVSEDFPIQPPFLGSRASVPRSGRAPSVRCFCCPTITPSLIFHHDCLKSGQSPSTVLVK